MTQKSPTGFIAMLDKNESELVAQWTDELLKPGIRSEKIRESELRDQCAELLRLLRSAATRASLSDISTPEWADTRSMLESVSRSRAKQGFTPSQVATFVMSLKGPVFRILQTTMGADQEALFHELWTATSLIDKLALYTTEAYQKGRDEIILRQQEEMLELSTPVVKLWEGILALPIIGTLDSARTQTVMENLLQAIVSTGAEVAIIDITGVPTVDTLVSQHLLKTVAAARLMGADCIISGIRPQIAQTIVHLGVDLTGVITKATLADAFVLALKRTGSAINHATNRQ